MHFKIQMMYTDKSFILNTSIFHKKYIYILIHGDFKFYTHGTKVVTGTVIN